MESPPIIHPTFLYQNGAVKFSSPSFNGELENYLNFGKFTTQTLIDFRNDVSDVDKFQYILSVINGEEFDLK